MEEKNKKSLVDKHINESDVSVFAYDKSIVEDLRARFKGSKSCVNDTVQITPNTQAFDIIGQLNDDNIVMPFVSLERVNWQLNLDRQGYQTFIGDRVFTRLDANNTPTEVRAQVIPITINYRLSVWSVDRVTNDALVRELLFYYHLRPSLMVYIRTWFKYST